LRALEAVKTLDVPDEVEIKVDARIISVTGEKGTLTRDFSAAPIAIELENKKLRIQTNWPRKREAALVGTISSHIQNMITGVTKGYVYKLKIVFSHFPISVKVQGNKVSIENFTGERSPRWARIMGDAEVSVKEDDVIIQGINLEDVSQTAANIELATRIKRKDPRVFLDGIFVYQKKEGIES